MAKPDVHSIVILNYNDYESTSTIIDKIHGYNTIDNIVVVDNMSKDDSFDKLLKVYGQRDKLHIIRTDKNGGYAYGNHWGCMYAINKLCSAYITIANPDVYFTEEVLRKQLDFLAHHNDAGAVTSRMVCKSGIDLPVAWKTPRYRDCLLENLMILRKLVGDRTRYSDSYLKQETVQVDALPGSFFSISSEAYLAVSGFDLNTFLYYEENILAKKLRDKGYRNYLLGMDSYDHMHSVSINNSFRSVGKKLKIAYKSREYYVSEYLKVNSLALAVLRITFYVGLVDYSIVNFIRSKCKAARKARF